MLFNKTVLQITPELNAGGAERSTVEIAEAVVAAGGRAIIASKGGRLEKDLVALGAKVVRLPVHSKNPWVMLANAGRLQRLIETDGVDIVHVRSRAPAWSALMAARRAGKPLVATYHGAYEAKGPMKRFYNSAMVRGDLVIANSLFTAKSIFAQHHFPPAKLKVIPRGADLKVFDPERVAPERIDVLEKAWNAGEATRVGPQTLKLLLPARMTFWKGQDVAIRAFTRLISGRSRGFPATGQSLPLRLVLAGDSQGTGDFARGLEREVDQRGVREMVTFVGHCADMPAAYLWADAVLSPATLPEAFGRVAVEAGAMARPVVASDLGGQKETVIDGATGLLVPAGDDEALADAIAELYAMGRQGRAAMGARARVHVAAHFSADAMRRATLEAYRDLLN